MFDTLTDFRGVLFGMSDERVTRRSLRSFREDDTHRLSQIELRHGVPGVGTIDVTASMPAPGEFAKSVADQMLHAMLHPLGSPDRGLWATQGVARLSVSGQSIPFTQLTSASRVLLISVVEELGPVVSVEARPTLRDCLNDGVRASAAPVVVFLGGVLVSSPRM